MLASPVPIYLGCAGLIVGSLGLGAQYLIGANSVSNKASEPPLFARSVEEASLPAQRWMPQSGGVAHFEPMVQLLTTPARLSTPSSATVSPQQNPPQNPPVASGDASRATAESVQEPPRAAPPEVVRDLSQPQTSQPQTRKSRRARNTRERNDETTEQVDPREARAQEPRAQESRAQGRRQTATQDVQQREQRTRSSERRYRDRDEADAVETRGRPEPRRLEQDERRVRDDDWRQRDSERRIVVREPEPRLVSPPERRDFGASPFRLFGIFE